MAECKAAARRAIGPIASAHALREASTAQRATGPDPGYHQLQVALWRCLTWNMGS
jgi:hypothetical protein